MSAPKKFGTFSGVFTPAILTILGVIMYMRLPWIVGQAGLYATIGIIVVAHIISVTTGLSVASISTDKRVKTGGTYYMISRSLGLPIGGTLGLALFVGLSFSVSLYLIGFSESFLGFWGFSADKNMIRLTGSIALLSVTIITFISTSLALKTQFFILVAIILSLFSILIGRPETAAVGPQLHPIATSAPFIVLFGIFFPAVTGFEAGVSMSGDLKDPKKSIPGGTITAIVVGLVVYIGMAIFFSWRVPSEQLVNNPNVLLDISFFSPLVVAGIWGATLSSALGSILGAPRILQAVSTDKITPKFFGKGYGKGNEPRNALLLTFLIAEAGILVGELDVIARIVSMFFIMTYGFLNMSCAIENWASPDFRPEFRVSKIVSIVGSITCFIVMIQLDLIAMIGAIILLTSVFFYLKRKELTLESGDTWEGVWSSVIREGLNRLNRNKGQQRNWRPNIILFSGGSSVRPQLVDLGKRLVHKRGILSNFDLIETEGGKTLFRKSEQSLKEDSAEFDGVFARRVECEDIYEAMETISKYYGFSGLEPNTIMMGWARNSRDPVKFVRLVQTMSSLDYNLLLLNYDEKRGFGKHEQIDIWWRGIGNTIAFALALCRFLATSDEWQNATIRFLMITEDSSLIETLHANMAQVISDYRLEATIRVINNSVEQIPFYDIIKKESKNADLIINGIPDIQPGEEENYVLKTNAIIDYLGTVLLIRASSFFGQTSIGLENRSEALSSPLADTEEPPTDESHPSFLGLSGAGVGATLSLSQGLKSIHDRFDEAFMGKLFTDMEVMIDDIRSRTDHAFHEIEKEYIENERLRNYKTMTRELGDFLYSTQKVLTLTRESLIDTQKETFETGIHWILTQCDALVNRQPEITRQERSRDDLVLSRGDRWRVKIGKVKNQIRSRLSNHTIVSTIRFRSLARQAIYLDVLDGFWRLSRRFVFQSLQLYPEIQRTIDRVVDSLSKTANQTLHDAKTSFEALSLQKDELDKAFELLSSQLQRQYQQIGSSAISHTRQAQEKMIREIKTFDSHRHLLSHRQLRKKRQPILTGLSEIPDIWKTNHDIMRDTVFGDMTLLSLKNRVTTILKRDIDDIKLKLKTSLIDHFKELLVYLEARVTDPELKTNAIAFSLKHITGLDEMWQILVDEIRNTLETVPDSMEIVLPESLQLISEEEVIPFERSVIPIRRLIEYYFESGFIGPMEDRMLSYSGTISQSISIGQDIIRLISLNVDEMNTDDAIPEGKHTPVSGKIFSDAVLRVSDVIKKLEETQIEIGTDIDSHLQLTLEKLNLYQLTSTPDDSKSQKRDKKERKSIKAIREQYGAMTKWVSKTSTQLLYRNSTRVDKQVQQQTSQIALSSKINRLLLMVETASPKSDIIQCLPFYYRHLFLGRPSITKEFWVGRQKETQQAAISVSRHKGGVHGALLITGEPGSGKSSLSQYVANRFFEKQKIAMVTAPEGGSSDIAVFDRHIQAALDSRERIDTLFRRLPGNSVVIFDDIGKWCARKENGYQVLERLLKVIDDFSDRCFFIVNLDWHQFRFLNFSYPLEKRFIDIIHCSPFDIPSLKEIIMLRHKASGLKFVHQNRVESEMNDWQLARLFTRLFKKTNGNVSRALIEWIRSIEAVQKDELVITAPGEISTASLSLLDPEDILILNQYLLHGAMTTQRLKDVTVMLNRTVKLQIASLKRAGLIREKRGNMTFIDPYIHSLLLDDFIEKGLI